jgi:ActR/RegA family two-component response regulator
MAELAADRRLPLAEVTRLYGLAVLAREGGNVSRAARVLGVSRRTLIRWRATR